MVRSTVIFKDFPRGALFPYRFSITLIFPWTLQLPLASAQQPNTVTPPETGFLFVLYPLECSKLQEQEGA